eukprot:gene11927-13013_t
MNQLPTVIQFEILNFLHHFDRLEYCRVNKLCSEEFSTASRIITFRYGRGLDQFMEDEWFRDSIIRKLKDPSNQLSLQLYGERPFHSFAINVKSLKTSTLLFQQFHLEESIIRHLALTPSFFNRTRHTSVLNEVRKVTGLKDLTISSFKDDIKDWTLLQNNSSVMVKSCANFNSLQLTNVKILRVEFPYRFLFISDIVNITHLKLTKVITSYQESFFTRLLAASETLQEIELEIDPQLILTQDGKIFLQSFQQLSTIKKIIININIKIQRDSNQFKEFYHLVKGLLGHVFSVEVSSTLSKVYLLPHRENNDQRSYRNKNCNDQMSYRNKNCLVM